MNANLICAILINVVKTSVYGRAIQVVVCKVSKT